MLLPPYFSFIRRGRLAGSGNPGYAGPLAETLLALRHEGIGAIVTLTEEPLNETVLREHDFDWIHVPVEDYTAPTLDQVERTIAFIERQSDHATLVHCAAGVGRTGTILACFLVAHERMGPAQAIEAIRAQRPGSLETQDQEDIVHIYARRLLEDDSPGEGVAT